MGSPDYTGSSLLLFGNELGLIEMHTPKHRTKHFITTNRTDLLRKLAGWVLWNVQVKLDETEVRKKQQQ